MGSDVESVWISLHNVDAGAWGHLTSWYVFLFNLWVAACRHGNCVDTCDTATTVITKVNCVLDGTASNIGFKAVQVAIVILIFDEDRVVLWNRYSLVVLVNGARGPLLGSEILGDLISIYADFEGLVGGVDNWHRVLFIIIDWF